MIMRGVNNILVELKDETYIKGVLRENKGKMCWYHKAQHRASR